DLTPAQRHVYLLRGPEPQTGRSTDGSIVPAPVQRRGEEEGFGKRLPDMPATTEMDLGNEA
ncbi:unnamed protein product, partial [Durusdinium trenchii]